MSLAIVFAVGSLMCAAANDVVFRLYARQSRAIGVFMAGVGLVWTTVFAGTALMQGSVVGSTTLGWGLLSGLFSAAANVLLIEAMARSSAGLCATVYRLNLAPAALLAIVLLGEPATAIKFVGLAFAVLAVLCVAPPRGARTGRASTWGIGLCVIAALLRAGMGVAYKAGLTAGADRCVLLALNGLCWVTVGTLYHAFGRPQLPSLSCLCRYSVISGILICGIVWFMASALGLGEASIVLPIAQLSFVGTALIGWGAMGEHLTLRQVGGLLLAVVCIALFAVA